MTHVKRILSLTLLCIATSATPRAQSPAPATLTLDRSGNSPIFLLHPSGDAAVSLPDCRGIVWEILNPELGVYQVLPAADACGPSAPPSPLPPEGLRLSPPTPPAYPAALRVVATVAIGCRTDRPFEIAACQDITTLTSANLTLQAPPP